MDRRPIGVFDSGLGGLTAVRELRAVLPGEDIVYFGDTGRVPYGSRGEEVITRYAREDAAYLLEQGVKAVICACGTVSSVAGEALAAAEIQGRLNERAVALLSARPMSRRELVDKLSAPARRRKKPSREADEVQPDPEALEREREALRQGAERAADWLEGLGLLNDGEYAGAVARHYAEKGYGPRKIQDELYRRGVPRAFWAEAMDGVSQGANVLDELLIRRLRGAEPTQENLKRACDYLARRGFSWEEIAQAVERYRRQGEE